MEDRMNREGIARQELNLIFVIDNSGSMSGQNIGAVNSAVRDVMSIMPEIQEETSDAQIKISTLVFNDVAKWNTAKPLGIEEYKWNDLVANGETNLSAAYEELSKWLMKKSHGGQMPDFGGIAPIIILMTDGLPTSNDWEEKLQDLKRKGWFKVSLKYALAIGIESDEAKNVLTQFTGNPETVLKVYSVEALRKVIKVIAVTASKVKSQSSLIKSDDYIGNNQEAQMEIVKELQDINEIQW